MTDTLTCGYDYSRWNPQEVTVPGADFIFLKATEGVTVTDSSGNKRLNLISEYIARYPDYVKPFVGFYHYARGGNAPEKEAEHFLSTINPHIHKCLIALDCEGSFINRSDWQSWALAWCEHVREKTGTIPFLYMSASETDCPDLADTDYPLWVAHYNVASPRILSDGWKRKPYIWQFTSKPIDCNLSTCSREQFANYINGVPV